MSGSPNFGPTSRYAGVETTSWQGPDGREIVYLRRRFVPPLDRYAVVGWYVVAAGDRVDNIAAQQLGDAEQYWRICDANGAQRPTDLTQVPGTRLRITLPEGIPGAPDG
jgi:nucleoid-associated protein YgaU